MQTEVTGNLKTGRQQKLTYQINTIEGAEEVIFITFWGLADNFQKNKSEFLSVLGTISGLTLPATKSSSTEPTLTPPTKTYRSNIAQPVDATEGAKKLIELKSLLDSGVINPQDYETKKQQILKSM